MEDMAKILIVEDEKFLRDLYADTLKNEGHEIDSAEDGETALQKMRQGGFDLVLLDIILPKMNGFDIMERLAKEPPTTPNKSVIFITNIDKGEEIKRALRLGNGYFIKSKITPGDLIREVNLYLSQGLPQT